MKAFVATLLAASAAAITQLDYEFMGFVSTFGKRYETVEEFNFRQQIYATTDAHIRSVNENPESTYKAGHNKFSDWTWEEFDSVLGLKYGEGLDLETVVEEEASSDDLPSTWDWRAQGMVTPVKDQGACGSCWAFSTIEAIESAWMIAGNQQTIMAPQELVDCTMSPVT